MNTKKDKFLRCKFLDFNWPSKFVHQNKAADSAEVVSESAERKPFEAVNGFDPKLKWTTQVGNLVIAAMGRKYSDTNIKRVIEAVDEPKLRDKFDDVKRIQIKESELLFLDKKGRVIEKFHIADELTEIVTEYHEAIRSQYAIVNNNTRRYFYMQYSPYGSGADGRYARITAPSRKAIMPPPGQARREVAPSGDPSATPPPRPLAAPRPLPMAQARLTDQEMLTRLEASRAPADPDQIAADLELEQLQEKDIKDRYNVLVAVDQSIDPGHAMVVKDVDVCIRSANKAEFNRLWIHMTHSNKIEELMTLPADPKEGYADNPFTQLGGTKNYRDILRDLIQKNLDSRLYLNEVCSLIYSKRFDAVKKTLESRNISKEVIGLLSKGDLIKSYRELREIAHNIDTQPKDQLSAKEKKCIPLLGQIKATVQFLGDYVAYAARLIQLVRYFRYDELSDNEETRTRKTMHQERNPNTLEGHEANRVIKALTTVFGDIDNPRLYPSGSFAELRYLFTRRKKLDSMTFQDLNGKVRTVPPFTENEWMTLYQSGETAYKLAFEASTVSLDEQYDRDPEDLQERISPDRALTYLNEALQIGITAYPTLPDYRKVDIKKIIERLSDAGARVGGERLQYQGHALADATNLYRVLALKELEDLQPGDDLIACERLKFIRIGSVIKQKEKARAQENLGESSPEKGRTVGVKFKKEIAREIVEQLKATKKFSDAAQLQKIEDMLVGGSLVIIPTSEGAAVGGGVSINIPFDNGVSIAVTASAIYSGGSPAVGAGHSVNKHFEISDEWSLDISIGGGASVWPVGAFFVGAGGRLERKFSKVDFSVSAGGGIALGTASSIIPTAAVGLGLNWAKYQENYKGILKREMSRAHFDQLKTPQEAFTKARERPDLYPEFADIIYKLENSPVKLSDASQRDCFMGIYQVMKEGIQTRAIDESVKLFCPTGLEAGVAMVGLVAVPYIAITFPIWKRKLVYRIATNDRYINSLSEATAQKAMMEDATKKDASNKPYAGDPILSSESEILLDSQTGTPRLRIKSGGSMDFSFLDRNPNQFHHYRMELARKADIIVNAVGDDKKDADKKGMGLIELIPQGSHGNEFVYIDPELGDDVIAVTEGDRLFLSVKNGREIFFKREDITYPFQNDGAVEKTIITISGRKHRRNETIRRKSEEYLLRLPKTNWAVREGNLNLTPGERAPGRIPTNIKTFAQYKEWWASNPGPRQDRVQLETFISQREAYEKAFAHLKERVAISQDALSTMTLRVDLAKKVEELLKDKKFLYKHNWTLRYDLPDSNNGKKKKVGRRKNGQKPRDMAEWKEDYSALVKYIKAKLEPILGEPPLNELELEAVMMQLLIASFVDAKDKTTKEFRENFADKEKGFMRRMMFSLFLDFYKDLGEKERIAKANAAADHVIDQLKNVDITADGTAIEGGVIFASIVGTPNFIGESGPHFTGVRRILNFQESGEPYGALEIRALDVNAPDQLGKDVARMWVDKLYQYKIGAHKETLPDKTNKSKEFAAYSERIIKNLQSPLGLELSLVAAPLVLTPSELMTFSKFQGTQNPPELTPENDAIIKKYLDAVDKVWEAKFSGANEVVIVPNMFKIKFERFDLHMGIFKKCGNISAWMKTKFTPYHIEQPPKRGISVGRSEVIVDVSQYGSIRTFAVGLGIAAPVPYSLPEVRPEPEPTTVGPPPPGPEKPRIPTADKPKIPTVEKGQPPTTDKPSQPGKPNPVEPSKPNQDTGNTDPNG